MDRRGLCLHALDGPSTRPYMCSYNVPSRFTHALLAIPTSQTEVAHAIRACKHESVCSFGAKYGGISWASK